MFVLLPSTELGVGSHERAALSPLISSGAISRRLGDQVAQNLARFAAGGRFTASGRFAASAAVAPAQREQLCIKLTSRSRVRYIWRMTHLSHMSDPVFAISQDSIPKKGHSKHRSGDI